MSKVKTQLVIEGKNNSKAAFEQVNRQLESMNSKLATAGKALVAAFSVSQLTGAVRGIAAAADSYNLMTSRLKLATGSQDEFNAAQTELRRIAAQTEAPLASLVTLYGRISRPLKEAGRSQADILRVTEAVATSFRVSGASAQEAENGVIQFAQALGSGALRGDEFNSVAEQAPRLMQALADGIGVPVGALKEMAAQGELTASVVTNALVSQLDVLRKESETLPDTVGGAMTKLTDRWNEAIGQADMQPLIDALNELSKTVSDPAVVAGLTALGSAMVKVVSLAAQGAAEFANFGDYLGYMAAKATGQLAELDRANKEIEMFQNAINGWGVADLKYTEAEQRAALAQWEAYRAHLIEQITGMTAEMQAAADEAVAIQEQQNKLQDELNQKHLSKYSSYIDQLKTLQDEQVKAAEDASKKLVAAEKKATADLERVRAERVKIERKYEEAKASFRSGGGDGEASYSAANSLRVQARQALKAGDTERAKAAADAALKMLQDLAAAGENTYGFDGIADDLMAIEVAANGIEEQALASKFAGLQISFALLVDEAKKLENIKVSVTADEESIQAVRNGIRTLAEQLGQTQIVLPISYAAPGAPAGQQPPGFASGGMIRGPGSGTSDSILARLSNGEFVMRAAAVRHYGPELLAMMNGLQLPRFADGGLVETAAAIAPPAPGRDLGRVELSIGGESYSVLADPENFDRILRRTAMKRGRTRV